MKDASLSTLFFPVLAIFALIFPFALQPPKQEAKKAIQTLPPAAASKPAVTPPQPNNAAALICEFAAPNRFDASGREQCKGYWEGTEHNLSKIPNFDQNVAQVETLIATVPDPKESSFDYAFDRYLEAMQRALEATEYKIDRYDLPWQNTGKEKEKESEAASASRPHARSAHEPGVVLFRKNKGNQTALLVLFLIGETPTSGIQKAALLRALDQAKHLRYISPPALREQQRRREILLQGDRFGGSIAASELMSPESPIRLLGTTYTGSATSLAITLRSWLAKNASWQVNIISGSATGIDVEDFLARSHPSDPAQVPHRVRFAATVTHTNTDLEAFIGYLNPKENRRVKIAMLLESNTAYGQSISHKSILNLPFPLNISELRTEAERANAEGTKKSTEVEPAERKKVPLGMGQSNGGLDALPLFSQVEIASREMVLSNLLSTIKRESITHLGLVATNVQDRIFLVREIRQHCPNVVMFNLNSDILYLHPEARAEFRGMLLVTPYSLFNQNQRWTYPFAGEGRRLQFPAPMTHGIYNATLALLNRPELMLEYGSPFDSPPAPKPRFIGLGEVRKPSLWVSVVGRDRVWPIKTLDYEDKQHYLFYPGAVREESSPKYESFKKALKNEVAPSLTPKDAGEVIAALPDLISGALSSKMPLIGMLLLSLLCCAVSGVLLLELARTKLHENINPFPRPKKGEGESKPSLQKNGTLLVRLVRWLAERPILRAIDRSPLAMIFSDPVLEDATLKFKRRCYLLMCSLILLGLALIVAAVHLMPIIASLRLASDLPKAELGLDIIWQVLWKGMTQYVLGSFLAVSLLLLTLLAALWMTASIVDWLKHWLNDVCYQPLKNMMDTARVEKRPLPLLLGWFIFLALLVVNAQFAASSGLIAAIDTYPSLIGQSLANPFSFFEGRPPQEDIFLFLRATDLMSGVSPLLPLLFVGLAAFLAFLSSLRRLTFAERACCQPNEVDKGAFPFLNFEGAGQQSFTGINELEIKVKEFLWCSFWKLNGSGLTILLLSATSAYLFIWNRASLSLEGWLFDVIFRFAFSLTVIFLALVFLRFVWLWVALRRLLRRLSWHPLFVEDSKEAREFFERLPKIKLTLPMPSYSAMVFSLEQARKALQERFQKAFQEQSSIASNLETLKTNEQKLRQALAEKAHTGSPAEIQKINEQLEKTSQEIQEQKKLLASESDAAVKTFQTASGKLQECHAAESRGDWRTSLLQQVETQGFLTGISSLVASELDNRYWNDSHKSSDPASENEQWVAQSKLFLASRVSAFLHLMLAQLKNLVVLVTAGLLLMLLAVSSYPFQPREGLMLFGWIAVLTVVTITMVIFVQMGRDKVISLLSHTTPGELNWSWEFALKVLLHGLIPIMVLLGAQFPQAVGQIVSWFSTLQGGHH